ncbi:oxidoreductase [Trichoderma austrokoningii]
MAPIRVGLIGLSTAKAFTGRGCWTAVSHLPALLQSPEYEIVALANSSVESAKRSIAAQGLPESTKAYGSADDLADDPDVDLIIVSVRVENHYELAKSALLRSKNVFVEWPMAASTAEVEELAALAKKNNVQTFIGAQGRASPVTQKLKELIASNRIGRIISSSVVACSLNRAVDVWPESMKPYLDMESGGNEYTIVFGHFLDSFVNVLGDLSHIQSIFKTGYKTVQLTGPDNTIVDPAYVKTSPDQILVQGVTSSGAVASIAFRKPRHHGDEHDLRWYISGTEGEIMVTSPATWSIADKGAEIRIRTGDGPFEVVDFQSLRLPAAESLSPMAANVHSMYDAFAKGDTTRYATFESAANTHRILDEIKKAAYID